MKRKQLIAAVLACATVLSSSAMSMMHSQAATTSTPRLGSVTLHVSEKTSKEQMEGVEFTCYKIMDMDINNNGFLDFSPAEGFESVLNSIEPDELGEYSATEIEALSQELKEAAKDVERKLVLETDETGSICFDDLPIGYYLFVETKVPEGYTAGKSFIVSVPTADTTDSEVSESTWMFDVDVYVKHERISIDKELSKSTLDNGLNENTQDGSVGEGDYVQYTVATAIPDFSEDYFYKNDAGEYLHDVVFDITDVMSDGLTIQNTTDHPIKVTVDGTVATAGADYKVTTNELKGSEAEDLKIEFANAFLEKNIGKEVVVTYFAYVNSDAVMGVNGNKNTVTLEYSNNPTEGTTVKTSNEESEVDVYSFGMNIIKFTNEDGTKPLEGAEFDVYCARDMSTAYKEKIISDENGKIELPRLDAGVYYIQETKAPEGYTPLKSRIKVEIVDNKDANGYATGTYTLLVNGNKISAESGEYVTIHNQTTGISTIAIENHKGFTLPETGGNGVYYFVLAGAAGMACIMIGVSKKSKRM